MRLLQCSRGCSRRRVRRWRGHSMVETLVALPIVLLLGLAAWQLAMLYQARGALRYAIHEAARAGSVAHAQPAPIEQGLARGLVPLLYGARSAAEFEANAARVTLQIARGRAAGWITLRQRAPTQASFDDWGEPALGGDGEPLPGLIEIPNDNLPTRALRMMPASGVAGERRGQPIGAASGTTLLDANLLKLELVYGVPLAVPLVGRLLGATLAAWAGCIAGAEVRLGALRLSAATGGGVAAGEGCASYLARDEAGRWQPRAPVRVAATIRMQSAARPPGASGALPPFAAEPPASVTLPQPPSPIPAAAPPEPADADDRPPAPVASASTAGAGAAHGFLRFGSDRELPDIAACRS